ncbi:Monosaccharide ABC transporter membrane protein, CUT2 family [uncultured Pleomorphomonas sp.]|uniref:Monosaccharide ABC transporter membrane protein, CUT2 family n=1 Tax=uncultured Pleomorphomonas sp. TaxID=442121 RepID=A0A212LKI4_9HYPH|nr:ABC transporter permease [uncultured Pleomorphomonas sp.]SCM78065.1 Monosaccharide ABC transporter membrane protein, CUT2 family [uncultured Pleomorphomonas sp.]
MASAFKTYGTLIGFVLVVVFFWIEIPDTFMTAKNWLNISQQVSMLAVVAFTMTIVMVMGDFDLSVGSMASLAGIVAALAFRDGHGVWVGVALALVVGLAGGLLNGALVAYVGILPFVATLGTLTVYSGLAFLVSGGKTIFGRDIPPAFSGFARSGIPLAETISLPSLTIVAALVLLVVWFVLEQTTFGRRLYAIGGNKEAARLAGIRVRRLRFLAFGLSGLGAATAGLMYASRVASANPTQGSGLMLDAIAAVFLGMTMSEEGEPHVAATLVGVLILGVLGNGLTQMSIDSYVREVLIGSIIVLAVATSSIGKARG